MKPKGPLPCSHKPTTRNYLQLIISTSSHPTILRSFSMVSFHPHLGVSSGLFLSSFPTKTLYAFLISLMHPTCPTHLILLSLITLIISGEEEILWSLSLCSFLQPAVISSLLGSYILLSTMFSNTVKSIFFPQSERPNFIPV